MLILLNGDKLQLVHDASDVKIHVSYIDKAADGTITAGRVNASYTSAATSDVLAGPAAGVERNVDFISIENVEGAASAVVALLHNDATVSVRLRARTLAAGEVDNWSPVERGDKGDIGSTGPAGLAGLLAKITVIDASGTFTPDTNLVFGFAEGVAAGGGGGGSTSPSGTHTCSGGGGGSGEHGRVYFEPADVAGGVAVTIGAAGTGGAAGANNGGNGGNTSFGSLLVCQGGTGGGGGGTGSLPGYGGPGGGYVTPGTGDVMTTGNYGGVAPSSTTTYGYAGARGADSPMGGGGAGRTTASLGATGIPAVGPGGGGGGGVAFSNANNFGGGAGWQGRVVVTEYILP